MLLESIIERNIHFKQTMYWGRVFLNDFGYEAGELVKIIGICENSEDLGNSIDTEGHGLEGNHDGPKVVTEVHVHNAVEVHGVCSVDAILVIDLVCLDCLFPITGLVRENVNLLVINALSFFGRLVHILGFFNIYLLIIILRLPNPFELNDLRN